MNSGWQAGLTWGSEWDAEEDVLAPLRLIVSYHRDIVVSVWGDGDGRTAGWRGGWTFFGRCGIEVLSRVEWRKSGDLASHENGQEVGESGDQHLRSMRESSSKERREEVNRPSFDMISVFSASG